MFVCAGCQAPYPGLHHPVGAQLPGVPAEDPAGELLTQPAAHPPLPRPCGGWGLGGGRIRQITPASRRARFREGPSPHALVAFTAEGALVRDRDQDFYLPFVSPFRESN